jgi:hypothetical protein
MTPDTPTLLPYSSRSWWRVPNANDRPGPSWYVASRGFALGVRAIPKPFRFPVARKLSTNLGALLQRASWYRRQQSLGIDRPEDIALHYALNIMSNSGTLFDLPIAIEGEDVFLASLKRSRGTIILSPHTLLSMALFRLLYDRGLIPTIVSAAPVAHIYGTRLFVRTLMPSTNLLFQVRTALRRHEIVCAMIDNSPRSSTRTMEFPTSEGPVFVSSALMQLANRCDASVLFMSARLGEREIILTFGNPGDETNDLLMTKSFVEFFARHLERRRNPSGTPMRPA